MLKEQGRKSLRSRRPWKSSPRGISLPKRLVVKSIEEAVNSASDIGYPRFESRLARAYRTRPRRAASLRFKDASELESALMEMLRHIADGVPRANIEGFISRRCSPWSRRGHSGSLKDAQLGPRCNVRHVRGNGRGNEDFRFRLAPNKGRGRGDGYGDKGLRLS